MCVRVGVNVCAYACNHENNTHFLMYNIHIYIHIAFLLFIEFEIGAHVHTYTH
jgi:hypothetical protein